MTLQTAVVAMPAAGSQSDEVLPGVSPDLLMQMYDFEGCPKMHWVESLVTELALLKLGTQHPDTVDRVWTRGGLDGHLPADSLSSTAPFSGVLRTGCWLPVVGSKMNSREV